MVARDRQFQPKQFCPLQQIFPTPPERQPFVSHREPRSWSRSANGAFFFYDDSWRLTTHLYLLFISRWRSPVLRSFRARDCLDLVLCDLTQTLRTYPQIANPLWIQNEPGDVLLRPVRNRQPISMTSPNRGNEGPGIGIPLA